jgi:hypothetical protein
MHVSHICDTCFCLLVAVSHELAMVLTWRGLRAKPMNSRLCGVCWLCWLLDIYCKKNNCLKNRQVGVQRICWHDNIANMTYSPEHGRAPFAPCWLCWLFVFDSQHSQQTTVHTVMYMHTVLYKCTVHTVWVDGLVLVANNANKMLVCTH